MRRPSGRHESTDETEAAHAAPPSPDPAARARAWQEVAREYWQPLSAFVLLVVGIVFVTLGWYGAAHTNIQTEQTPYLISGGLLGLGLIIVAGFLGYTSLVERQLRELRRDLRNLGPMARATAPDFGGAPPGADGRVYVVPGGRAYHAAGCPIIEGKEGVRGLEPAQASGYAQCKLCGPD